MGASGALLGVEQHVQWDAHNHPRPEPLPEKEKGISNTKGGQTDASVGLGRAHGSVAPTTFYVPSLSPTEWGSPQPLDTQATSCFAGATGTPRGKECGEGHCQLPRLGEESGPPAQAPVSSLGCSSDPHAPRGPKGARRKWGCQPSCGAAPTASPSWGFRGGDRQGVPLGPLPNPDHSPHTHPAGPVWGHMFICLSGPC